MAVAYAALVSLMNVLSRVQYPTCAVSLDQTQIHSLFDRVSSLVNFLEAYSKRISKDFERKMTDAAFAAEDTIESHIVNRVVVVDEATFCQDLKKRVHEMDLIFQEAMEVSKKNGEKDHRPESSVRVGSPVPHSGTIKIAGYDEQLNQLLERLTSHDSSRKIIPVVGMGGIGKTTLALNVYNNPHVKYFDAKAWVTISQDFTVGKIIRRLLRDIGVSDVDTRSDEQLGTLLHKGLWGRRYLIILDDVWDNEAWERIIRYCPDNNNRSRILLTTRIMDVALGVRSCSPFEINLLNDDRSWELLSKKVFGQEACPPELEKWGKKIAASCKGLPLAIVVIGGLLKTSRHTQQYWEDVSRNISSIISKEDNDSCLKILSLSYHQLPIHLKPCFLYMATFPEDYEVCVSEVIMLWAADGFLKPKVDNTLEDVALECLNDLINRNLIIVQKRDFRGKAKRLTIHDFVRDVCMIEAQNEKFLCVNVNGASLGFSETIESQRRLVSHDHHGRLFSPGMHQKVVARSIISFYGLDLPPPGSWLSLLRVFQVDLPIDFIQLINLRYLKCSTLLSSISSFWNLETLIVKVIPQGYRLPCEIWKLQNIKHLVFPNHTKVVFPDPPTSPSNLVFKNLQTLKGIKVFSDDLINSIPNIKKLGIDYERKEGSQLSSCFDNLVRCHKLETLNFAAHHSIDLATIKFPSCLRKLTFFSPFIRWEHMTTVGSLPNLEVLELRCGSYNEEWISIEGEFKSLKLLTLESVYLVTWTVEDCSHFPNLQCLNLKYIKQLEEIPRVFGESMTLESVQMFECSRSVVMSANQILEDQNGQGNDGFIVEVGYPSYSWDTMTMELKEELKSLANDSFHLSRNALYQ